MLALAQETVPDVERLVELVLPDDPIPTCDAIVAVGHPLSYLPDEDAINRALSPLPGPSVLRGCSPSTSATWSGARSVETPKTSAE